MADLKGHVRYLSGKLDDDDEDEADEEEGSLLSDADEKEIERVASDLIEMAMLAKGGEVESADSRHARIVKKLRHLVARTKARSGGSKLDQDERYHAALAKLGPGKE